MRRPVLGDIFELKTAAGRAYVQFSHETKGGRFGEVLRVIDGLYAERPNSLKAMQTKFFVLYPLKKLVRKGQGYVEWVGNEDIPSDAREFPTFRNGTPGSNGKIANWWLWDGQAEWRIGALGSDQRGWPFFEVLNPEALVEAIESGWTPENDPRN